MSENTENKEVNMVKEKENTFNLAREVWEWFYTIVIALLLVLLVKAFIFDIVRVDGESMFPNLHHNDRLIVTKLGYKPEPGDIIILDSTYKKREAYYDEYEDETGKDLNFFSEKMLYFKLPDQLRRRYYVKRVIGMPGDTVDIKDGKVYVNGGELFEPYFDGETRITDYSVSYPVTVDEGHIFVMGDNRSNSSDSRSSSLGLVPIEAVIGKSQFRIWPFQAFGVTE